MYGGIGIRVYGGTGTTSVGNLSLWLDGVYGSMHLNDAIFTDGVMQIYRAENMEDGDHQLTGSVSTSGEFLLDHFECDCPCPTPYQVKYANNLAASRIDNSSGDGFDLVSAGPTAQNVPAQAVIVDNIDPAVIYDHRESQWFDGSDGIGDYGRSVSSSLTPGASLSYSFDGVAIWYECVSHTIL